jgi:hypothetical protein
MKRTEVAKLVLTMQRHTGRKGNGTRSAAYGVLAAGTMILTFAFPAMAERGVMSVPGAGAPAYADLETSETFALPRANPGNWRLTLTLEGTASNCVEVAFGRDADTNAVLGAGEIVATVGWDRGVWFVAGGDGLEQRFTATPSGNTLTLDIYLASAGGVKSAAFGEGRRPLPFAGMPPVPAWLDPRKWDTARLTARGGGARAETAEISVFPDGTLIRLK